MAALIGKGSHLAFWVYVPRPRHSVTLASRTRFTRVLLAAHNTIVGQNDLQRSRTLNDSQRRPIRRPNWGQSCTAGKENASEPEFLSF